jgi:D-sedoheptulose 7-phosphate isomerase
MLKTEASPIVNVLRESIADAIAVCESLDNESVYEAVTAIVDTIVRSIVGGGRVLLCGNGGSAADAQHLAAELVGRFYLERPALPAISLADNVAAITAIANDYSYDDVFARGVQAYGRPGDILIGLSTSGSSRNVVAALNAARNAGLSTIALVGRPDCTMAELADHVVCVPGTSTARVQEGHMLIGHTIFELVERELCPRS